MNERDIFMVALQRDASADRHAYVAEACHGDEQLRQGVEALLAAHERAGSFLAVPALDAAAPVDGQPIREGPGAVIGPYKLLEEIGEGGFGVVFMAEQQRPVRRKAALKVIKPGMDSRQVIARFEAERQALALMDHPNIARVFDAGETTSGRPYFVMELVRGVPITDFCDANPLSVRQRLELFISVCQAVQHAHHKGIIHRDLKPTNVLVTLHDGTPVVKIIDFGINKALGQQLTETTLFTNFAQLLGTPIYMSPEQAEMSGLDIDTRADIYSLGVLLYELLTGTTPRDKEQLRTAAYDEIRRIIREEEADKPSTRISTLGQAALKVSANRQTDPRQLSQLFRGELDWIVMKALEKDRNRRYDTASALAADVQRYLDDEQVQACPPSAGYRLRKFFRRHKGPLLAASIVMLALMGGIIGTTLGMIRATGAEAEAVKEAEQKETALSAARQSEQDAKEQLFLSLLNQARSGRFSRQMGQRLDSLAALEKAGHIRPDDRLRDEAIAAMALPDIHRGPSLHAFPAGTKALAFDGLYQSYARINEEGIISIRSIPDNAEIRCIPAKSSSRARSIRLSPNGQFLAVFDDNSAVQLWRVADGKPLLREVPRPCSEVAFSCDSRQLAIAQDDWILFFDLTSGQETHRWRLPAKAYALVFHPKNGRLAVSYSDSTVASIYDSAQGRHVADLPIGPMNHAVIAWERDGDRLAVAGSDPRIQVWDVATQRKLAILEGHADRITTLSFHPDGGLLASGSWDGVLRLWDPATGRQLMQLPLSATSLQFSSTGQWLGCLWQGDEQLQLLEVTPSREYRTIVSGLGAGRGRYMNGDISPDGRLLALSMAEAGDRLWELSSGRELAVLPSGSNCVLFHPEGRELLTCGSGGLDRWSIEESKATANELFLGPPHKIALPFVPISAARSPNSRTLATVSEASGAGLLMDLGTATVQGQLFAHPKASEVALSQDGRWLASSGWHSDRVRLWNAKTGTMVHEWVLGTMTRVFFTPDSRALIICRGDAFTFWDVETLQPIRRLARDVALYPGHAAFSLDGALMALEMAPGVMHLMEVATGRTIAKLEDPHGDRAGWMGFTPDGTQLVVAASFAKAIHIWDLRAIRERLKVMGLDWDWPEFPPADHQALATDVAKVNVLPGDQAELDRNNARTCNNQAWVYLTAPAGLRDVNAALLLAEDAVRLEPENANYRNTLGVAYYRAGRYREAVELLRANLDKQDDKGLAFDLYFMAMSHHHLGETDRARDYLAWAIRWTTAQGGLDPEHLEELKMFRAEAEELMGTGTGP
jgi:serine/threonine protein kinase/WD40 repeat protein